MVGIKKDQWFLVDHFLLDGGKFIGGFSPTFFLPGQVEGHRIRKAPTLVMQVEEFGEFFGACQKIIA